MRKARSSAGFGIRYGRLVVLLLTGLLLVSVDEADDKIYKHQYEDRGCQDDKGEEESRKKVAINHVSQTEPVSFRQRLQKGETKGVAGVVAPAARGILQYLSLPGY